MAKPVPIAALSADIGSFLVASSLGVLVARQIKSAHFHRGVEPLQTCRLFLARQPSIAFQQFVIPDGAALLASTNAQDGSRRGFET